MKNEKGITLVSLLITVIVMVIIAGVTVYTSENKLKANDLKKMQNDIEFLNDKISTYYMNYGEIPTKEKDKYVFHSSDFNFETNINDNGTYYVIDLEAIGNISLNYGKEGYNNPLESDDVYIISENTHTVYYLRGIESANEKVYHSLPVNKIEDQDYIPPTKPQINVVSGDKIYDTDENNFKTNVTLEFVPGKSNTADISKTTYSVNDSQEKNITELKNNEYSITTSGRYSIKIRSYKSNGIYLEQTKEITVGIIKEAEYLESTGTQYLDMGIPYKVGMGFYMKAQQQITEKVYSFPFGVADSTKGNNISVRTGSNIGTRFSGIGTFYNKGFLFYGRDIGLLSDGNISDTMVGFDINNNLYEGYCNYLGDNKIRVIMNDVETTFNIDLSTRLAANEETSINMTMFGIHTKKADGTEVENRYTENCKAKIYEVRITLNKQTYANYKACYDSEKNEGYMYDTVNETYHYNKGTDTFKTNLSK